MSIFGNSTFDIALKSHHISLPFLVRAAISSAISSEDSFLQGKGQAGER